ncbi:nuclear transport factor 2 family protein [Psychroflexus sediminis]|uniref:SnoaL-like domain-containing protein n=1 Tax=Psychroflexus sediminis TaxID=470826 RepID=A0A1G7YGM1_9FLAO|nr:nuclear transport factor 2 family protein [Psychroflexus sediminis]SDG95395.1 SnoaL-like domain-containing protein [Psychroflexus sediminis]
MRLKPLISILSLVLVSTGFAQKQNINTTIDAWHKSAENANFESYFGLMTEDAVFVGSDASEVWNYEEFKAFSKPYFDAGKAWTFKSVSRNVYINENENMAWFDEVLNSDHMGLCRGSGVLIQTKNGAWKIKHYVLSLAVPNPLVDELVKQKSKLDRKYLETLH